MLVHIWVQLAGNGGICWNSWSFPRQYAPLPTWRLLPLWQRSQKGCRFPSELPSIIKQICISLAYRQGCRQKQSRSFHMPFQPLLLLLKWHLLRVRLCKQVWLVVISALAIWFPSNYGCDSISAFPAFLDTLLNSDFETWHSQLFLSNWLFCQAQKNPFPLTCTITPQESEVQLNGLTKAADGFYENWLVLWDFTNLCLATKRCCSVPLFCFNLLFFGLSLMLLLWHLKTWCFLKAEV